MTDLDDVIEKMVPDVAKILAHLEEQRAQGRFVALSGPDAAALVAGYDRVFLEEAKRAAVRSRSGSTTGNAPVEAGATAAAILCAVAACEAYLSEYIARQEFAEGKLRPEFETIREDPDALSQWKALLKLLDGGFDPGTSREYAALGCLLQVRDLVAHRHARTLPLGSFPIKLSDCVRQRIVPVHGAKDADWTSVVFVADVGEWAAETADKWLTLADGQLPKPTMR